jgi:high-affinity iron transporter
MRRQARRVKGELQAAVDRALAVGTAWGLAVRAFTAVIREGIETSLFLFGQVTAASGDQGALLVLGGALVGLLVAVSIGWLIYAGSRRINYGTFFLATGLALIVIAAGLLSHAVHELVEVGWITVGTQTAFDISGLLPHDSGVGQFLRALVGYTSTPEVVTLAVYLVYLLGVLWFYLRPVPVAAVQEKVPAGAS